MPRSASFDDIEFDGYGQFLSIACLQESKIDLRARAILQAGDGYSVLKGGHTTGNNEETLKVLEINRIVVNRISLGFQNIGWF
jgi:hypothetical protein